MEDRILPSQGPSDTLETQRKEESEPPPPSKSIDDMLVPELQAALKARGLPKSGRKRDLVARLQASIEAEGQPSLESQTLPQKRKLLFDPLPSKQAKYK